MLHHDRAVIHKPFTTKFKKGMNMLTFTSHTFCSTGGRFDKVTLYRSCLSLPCSCLIRCSGRAAQVGGTPSRFLDKKSFHRKGGFVVGQTWLDIQNSFMLPRLSMCKFREGEAPHRLIIWLPRHSCRHPGFEPRWSRRGLSDKYPCLSPFNVSRW